MAWIQTNIRFGTRTIVLTVDDEDVDRVTQDLFLNQTKGPEAMEKLFIDMIVMKYPHLAGCLMYAMDYNVMSQRFEFFISHDSFAPVGLGGRPPAYRFKDFSKIED